MRISAAFRSDQAGIFHESQSFESLGLEGCGIGAGVFGFVRQSLHEGDLCLGGGATALSRPL
jgi:hypothetical protein